jgi:cysteinyl-tRNA synthetase
MEWDSPWSRGFPGWHTECVVMGVKKLGIPFDIHCGGIDHIFIHHTNEIAQAEAAYEEILARYWLHGEFLILKKGRMGKSKGNIIILDNLVKKGINPLVYRYLCLTCHYRSKLIFSWQSLKAAENSLNIIYQKVEELKESYQKNKELSLARKDYKRTKDYQKQFREFINNDLDMPKALALTWSLLKDKQISSKIKYELLLDFDRVLGLDLNKIKRIKIPQQVKELVVKREKYRQQKKWKEADEIRMKIKQAGYLVEDTRQGQRIRKLRTTVA